MPVYVAELPGRNQEPGTHDHFFPASELAAYGPVGPPEPDFGVAAGLADGVSVADDAVQIAESGDDGADGGLAEPAGHTPGLDGRPGEVLASARAGRGHATFRREPAGIRHPASAKG